MDFCKERQERRRERKEKKSKKVGVGEGGEGEEGEEGEGGGDDVQQKEDFEKVEMSRGKLSRLTLSEVD